MKKIFTIITILITLSLIGIIVIQVSWIQNMLLIKKDQVRDNVDFAVADVVLELVEEKSKFPSLVSPKMITEWPKDQLLNLFRAPTVAQRYTVFNIQDKLRKGFEKHGLKDTRFEFAIVASSNSFGYEMQSANFEEAFEKATVEDTLNHWVLYSPINSLSGSDTESLSPDETLILVVSDFRSFIMKSLSWMIAGAIIFTLMIVAAFYITVRTLLRQKKLSEIKSDFINNMTHELKTPLATISLAVDAIRNQKVVDDKEKFDYFSSIIKDENKRMNKQVETILHAALLDKQEYRLNLHPLRVNETLRDLMDNFKLQLDERHGKIDFKLNAENDTVIADEIHFSNMLSNLLDNAIKYSKEEFPVQINVCTQNVGKFIRIRVEDNGIGMTKETLNRIFEKFYRAHTGNIHNVKGFGLGLSYVSEMVDAHKGKIKAESTPGKGSIFTVDIPLMQ